MKYMGPDKILWGTDSSWYASPHWQIEAFWRFQIPDDLQKQYGYPPLTDSAKRKILGLNSARLYQLPAATQGVYKPVPTDYAARVPDESDLAAWSTWVEADPVSTAPILTFVIFDATSAVPFAACSTLCTIPRVTSS